MSGRTKEGKGIAKWREKLIEGLRTKEEEDKVVEFEIRLLFGVSADRQEWALPINRRRRGYAPRAIRY